MTVGVGAWIHKSLICVFPSKVDLRENHAVQIKWIYSPNVIFQTTFRTLHFHHDFYYIINKKINIVEEKISPIMVTQLKDYKKPSQDLLSVQANWSVKVFTF